MDVWGPVLIGAALTVAGNGVVVAYFMGRITESVESLKQWRTDEAEPVLSDHEARISHMEGRAGINRR